MTNKISQRNQSEQSKIFSQFSAAAKSISTKLQAVLNNTSTLNFTNGKALSAVKAANRSEIDRLNQEYVVRTQDVLNEQALDFLVKNSLIDARTLTSIFAGFELARASREDKLNEQRAFDIDNLRQRTLIAQDQIEGAQEFNDAQSDAARDAADIELQNSRSALVQQSTAARADVSDQEARDAEVRANAQSIVDRDAGQEDKLEVITTRADLVRSAARDTEVRANAQSIVDRDASQEDRLEIIAARAASGRSDERTEAERFAALGRNPQPVTNAVNVSQSAAPVVGQLPAQTQFTPTQAEGDETLPLIDLNSVVPNDQLDALNVRRQTLSANNGTVFEPLEDGVKFVDVPSAEITALTGNEVPSGTQLSQAARAVISIYTSPLEPNSQFSEIPTTFEELTDTQQQVFSRLEALGIKDDSINLTEKNELVKLRQGANEDGDVVPFSGNQFTDLDSSVQSDLLNRRFKVLQQNLRENPLDGVVPEPVVDTAASTQDDPTPNFNDISLTFLTGLNDADDDVSIDIPLLQNTLIERGLPIGELTPEQIQEILDEEEQENNQ